MLTTLIQKEIMHHILSVRFIALLLMCALLIPLTLSINYRRYSQNLTDYQESVKRERTEAAENPPNTPDPNTEVSKFFLKPTPLSVFASGLEEALPTYLGMTRNGVRQGSAGVSQASVAYALGNLDFLFIVGIVFSLLALLFTCRCDCGRKRGRHASDKPVKSASERCVFVEQADRRIYCVRCSIFGIFPLGVTLDRLAGVPFR